MGNLLQLHPTGSAEAFSSLCLLPSAQMCFTPALSFTIGPELSLQVEQPLEACHSNHFEVINATDGAQLFSRQTFCVQASQTLSKNTKDRFQRVEHKINSSKGVVVLETDNRGGGRLYFDIIAMQI